MKKTKTRRSRRYFFEDKPVFGLDIGHGSLKVMQVGAQIGHKSKKPKLLGYGTTSFNSKSIDDGVIVDPETIANALLDLFKHNLIGDISTHRVALTIPSYRTFTRSISLPKMKDKDLDSAVSTEAEQYIPLAIDEMYLDYAKIREDADTTDLFVVAVPRKIVDSYVALTELVGLEPVLIETTMNAAAQLFARDEQSDVPAMLIDFGSLSSDISLCDGQNVLVMGTVQGGGETFTGSIKESLGVSEHEAWLIKTKYGLNYSKKQKEIVGALEGSLLLIVKEVQRMLRYYEDRFGSDRPIGQVVILGGGANIPGLGDWLTAKLRLPVRSCDPWQYLNQNRLQLPSTADKTMFATAAGLSVTNPQEVFKL
jgi:type IV pilus assembly protein PilM